MTDLKKQIELSVDASGVESGVNQAKRSIADLGNAAQAAGKAAAAGIDKIGEGGDRASVKIERTTKSLADSIQRATAAMQAGAKGSAQYFEALANARGANLNALRPYIVQLAEVEQQTRAAAEANQKLGVSTKFLDDLKARSAAIGKSAADLAEMRAAELGVADAAAPMIAKLRAAEAPLQGVGTTAKQTAAALRGVPAQITDIVTALQAGQAPLTVILQQGGQLKDMFGGIGPAARALGGYIVSLVNPLTLAAGAAGALALAYLQGRKESEGYTRAITLSGNAAGVTAGQLADMARNVARTVGTQGQAAAAIAELAGTGRVAAANLEHFTRVAVMMEKTVGQSVSQTAQEFADLGKAPVAASERLNEKYRYLTASVYAQIQALEDQGKVEQAAAVAQKAYADAFEARARQIQENLGWLEKGWKAVTGAAKAGWDAMLDVGRPDTQVEQLGSLANRIEQTQSKLARLQALGPGKNTQIAVASTQRELNALRQAQSLLQENVRLEQRAGAAAAASNRQNEARIGWLKEGDKYLTRSAQMEREVTVAREQGMRAGVSSAEIEERVGQIRKKSAAIFTSFVASQIEAIKRRGQIEDETARRAIDQLQANKQLGLISEREYNEQVAKLDLAEFDRKKGILAAELKLAAGKQNSLKEQAAILGAMALLDEQRLTRAQQLENEEKKRIDRLNKIRQDTIASEMDEDAAARAAEDRLRLDRSNAAIRLTRDYGKAIDENNRLTEYELTLLGRTGMERDAALAQYRIQIDLEREILRLDELQLDAEEKKSRIAELQASAARASAGVLQRSWLDNWKRINEDVGRSLTDELMRGGKNAGEMLRNYFKTLTLRPIIEAAVAPLSGAIASIFSPGGAPTGATGGVFQAASLLSAGKTLWQGFSSGMGSGILSQPWRTPGFGDMVSFGNGTPTGWVSAEGGVGYSGGMASDGFSLNGIGGMAGNALTGYTLSKAISNGFQVNSYIDKIGAVASAFFGPIAGVVSGAINRTFGRKVVGSGVYGTVSEDDFSGQAYQFKKGGFLRSSKTEYSGLDADVNAVFSDAIKGMYENFSALGDTIGVGSDLLKGFSYEFRLALADFDAAGKEKAIQAALARMSDSMAQAFVDNFRTSIDTAQQAASRYYTNTIDGEKTFTGSVVSQERLASVLDPYIDDMVRIFDAQRASLSGAHESEGKLAAFTSQLFGLGHSLVENAGYLKVFGEALDFKKLETAANDGETVVDTFGRLSSVFNATNAVAVLLGKNTETAFGAIGIASADARQRLIDLSGGIDSLAAGTAAFAENFLTEEEKMAPIIRGVREAMEGLGYASIDMKDEFKNLVLGLDLSTEAGSTLYAKLMAIAPAFSQVADYVTRTSESLRQTAIKNARASMDRAIGVVDSAYSALQRSVEAQRKLVAKTYEDTLDQLRARIDGVGTSIGKLTSLSGALRSTLDRMRLPSQSGADRTAAQAQIQAALTIARAGGVFPDADSISRALELVSQQDESQFATLEDAQRDFVRTANSINELAKLTDIQKSLEEKTLESLQRQLEVTEAGYQAENERLDGILSAAERQIEEVRTGLSTVNGSILSLGDAMRGFASSVAAARQNSIIAATPAITSAYQTHLYRAPEGDGLEYWQDQVAGGASVETVVSAIANSNEAKVQGLYKTILGRVGEAAGVDYWTERLNAGVSLTDVSQEFYKSAEYVSKTASYVADLAAGKYQLHSGGTGLPAFAAGGEHAGGWRVVGESGPEVEYTPPSRIYSNADSRSLFDTSRLETKLDQVTERLERAEAALIGIAQTSGRTARQLERWDGDGMPPKRVIA